jgi:hypothetical protein
VCKSDVEFSLCNDNEKIIKEDEMGGACNTNVGEEERV